ncbi:MAG: ATP-binding protein, partial [Micrococcales bacterium]|nr:ATP-binding protein [Micrococcales bacterium]
RDEIRDWYNGYNWTGQAVYNPFDVLLLFRKRQFRSYWFETGTPTFLIETLAQRQVYLPRLQSLEATDALLSTFEVGNISTEALLFQTGYLTIDEARQSPGGMRYTLRFPNREVRASLTDALLAACSPDPGEVVARTSRLLDLLAAGDLPGIRALFTAHFASIPHDWYIRLRRRGNELGCSSEPIEDVDERSEEHRNVPIAQYEGYYSSVFYTFFASLGVETVPEDTSSTGRLDLAVRYGGQVFLFEFKTVDDGPTGSALQQIKDKHYADKYLASGVRVHLVGVEFSKQKRNIVAFDTQTIDPH